MMPTEITLDQLNSVVAPQPKASKPQEITLDQLNAAVNPGEPVKEKGFLPGVGTNIAGQYKKAGKGFQIQAAEYDPENDPKLKHYGQYLGEAQRNLMRDQQLGIKNSPWAKKVQEYQDLIEETTGKIQARNSAPEVVARVQALQSAVQAINEEMSGARPANMGFWKSAAFDAMVSLGVVGPSIAVGAATGGSTIPLTAIGMQTFATSYADNRTKGLAPEKAGQLAAIDGVTEALTELIPTSKLIKNSELLKKFLESTITDIPGEVLANYVQTATSAVADLGPDPTDEQVEEALKEAVAAATQEIPSVAATTTMAGGALAAGTSAIQRTTRSLTKPPEVVPPFPTEPKAPPKKPHYKNPEEARKAAEAMESPPPTPENVPEGSEPLDLNELLRMPAAPEGPARGDVIDFEDRKLQREAQQVLKDWTTQMEEVAAEDTQRIAEEQRQKQELKDADVARRRKAMREGQPSREEMDQVFDRKIYESKRHDLEEQWIAGDISSQEYDQKKAELGPEPQGYRQLDEMVQQPPMSLKELVETVSDPKLRKRIEEFAGPAPEAPHLTGNPMQDRASAVKYEKELRKWAGEMPARGEKASVTKLPSRPKALTVNDSVPPRSSRLMWEMENAHKAARPVWDLIGNRAANVHKQTRANGTHKSASTVVSAHQLLDRLIGLTEGPYKDIMVKLKEFVRPDQVVNFQWVEEGEGLVLPDGSQEPPSTGGVYITEAEIPGGPVYIKTNEETISSPWFMRNIVHELWHSVTWDFIRNNDDAATVKQVKELYVRAVRAVEDLVDDFKKSGVNENAIREALGGWFEIRKDLKARSIDIVVKDNLYGLTNAAEMIAEANSNPIFMMALAKASPRAPRIWQRVQDIFHQVAGKIMEALGFNKSEGHLLHKILHATEELALAQKMMGAPKKKKKGKEGTYLTKPGSILRAKDTSVSSPSHTPQLRKPLRNALHLLDKTSDKVPGVPELKRKVDEYLFSFRKHVAPETLGKKAEHSAAILSKWIVNQMRRDASFQHQSRTRHDFWEKNKKFAQEFIRSFEGGWKPKDPAFREVADAYTQWNEEIRQSDVKQGIQYEAQDNYLYHIFEDHNKLTEYMQRKFGKKWGDPRFTKDRTYNFYDEAIKAGFKPKFDNPEDIMLARQHSSEIAHMKIGALQELYDAGLAWEKKPQHVETVAWRSPNGKFYYVHHEASAILHNAWNTESLWARQGPVGDAFRGAMYLKNRLVPIKLSLSLFHFLHVLTINNATGMLRATKSLMLGNISAAKWLKEMGKAAFYTDLISSPRFGGRIRAIFRGEIPPDQITPAEAQSIQFMIEGGMLPEQSHQYKSNAKVAFRNALLRARKQPWALGRAAYEAPFAALDWMQHWMFEKWIPSIKTTSYLKEVQTALELDPTLMEDQQRRQVLFHKLAKSVDNRHGEMVYKTMFWNKAIKDTAVVNLLSLGWQMGFIREYGGAIGDLHKIATREGSLPKKIKATDLDRPLFVSMYTMQALMYGGLLTWALTGEWPEEWKDYIYPKDGEVNPDGTPRRVNTMFYTREFSAIAKHIEQEGAVKGLSRTAVNKASGIFGLALQAVTGVDDFGKEYRDPNGELDEKFLQTMDFVFSEMTPISVGGIQREGVDPKTVTMNVLGFSKAPAYATRGHAESVIRETWTKYNAKNQTPFERAAYSADMKELRELHEEGDLEGFGEKFEAMTEEYDLRASDRRRIRQSLRDTKTPEQSMFQALTWQQQKRILDEMTPEEREVYLPYSNKSRLRRRYEAPEEE